MECIVNKKNLQDILKKIQKCISSNSKILEVASSVLVDIKKDMLILKATNFNMYIEDNIKDIKIKTEGKCLIPFTLFNNLVNKYPAEKIHLRKKDNNLELVSQKNLFEIPIVDIDFPEGYYVENDVELEFQEKFLKELFTRFEKIIPSDSEKNSINGLNINIKDDNSVDFVGTDTFRLYILNTFDFKMKGEGGGSYIIPKEMTKYISGVLDKSDNLVKLILNNNYVKLEKDGLVLKHQLISGSYPNYERILPKKLKYENKINSYELKEAIDRIKIVGDFLLGDGIMNFKTDENKNVLLYTSDMKNVEKLSLKLETDINKSFDYLQILDFLRDVKNDEILINFNDDNTSPVIFKDTDINYMVLPLRVRN